MGFTSPLGNLKSFASSRPPLVVFTLCLTAFALTTYSLAYFIKRAENVPNPDVRLDWNTFILHMAELDFCVLSSEESKAVSSSIQHSSTVTQGALATAATSDDHLNNSSIGITSVLPRVVADQEVKDLNGDNLSVVSLKVTASLSLIQELSTLPHNISTITGTLQAHQLELNVADVSQNATLNVTFHLPAGIQNASQPQEICITFEGPERFLPSTKSPPACYPSPLPSEADSHQAKFVGLRRGPPGQEVFTDSGYGFELWCNEGSIVHMVYHPDPELTVFLTVRDRSLINLHLLHTSYFLFVMAMTMVCYALIKGKPKQKQLPFDKVEDITYAELALPNAHTVYVPPVNRRQEPTVYAQIDVSKKVPQAIDCAHLSQAQQQQQLLLHHQHPSVMLPQAQLHMHLHQPHHPPRPEDDEPSSVETPLMSSHRESTVPVTGVPMMPSCGPFSQGQRVVSATRF